MLSLSLSVRSASKHVRLTMFFKRSTFIGRRRTEMFGVTEFVANAGGILSLYMGISLLSLVELAYFFTMRPLCNYLMRQRNGRTTGTPGARTDASEDASTKKAPMGRRRQSAVRVKNQQSERQPKQQHQHQQFQQKRRADGTAKMRNACAVVLGHDGAPSTRW